MREGASEVLEFWFGELSDGFADDAHRRRWFAGDAAIDAEIRERFGPLLTAALDGELAGWAESSDGALALVIVCDQFSRQVHRGTRQAYATDPLALQVALALVEQGTDLELGFDQRAFLYMPLHHSESRLDQHTSVGLYTALSDAAPADLRRHMEGFLHYARDHRDVVLRFGRFPHRNRVLGRPSTPAESAFLETAPGYGQSAAPKP
jgi:uncharacterized protein (DUF924 family)